MENQTQNTQTTNLGSIQTNASNLNNSNNNIQENQDNNYSEITNSIDSQIDQNNKELEAIEKTLNELRQYKSNWTNNATEPNWFEKLGNKLFNNWYSPIGWLNKTREGIDNLFGNNTALETNYHKYYRLKKEFEDAQTRLGSEEELSSKKQTLINNILNLKNKKTEIVSNLKGNELKYENELKSLKKVGISNPLWMLQKGPMQAFSGANLGTISMQNGSKSENEKKSDNNYEKLILALIKLLGK